MTQRYYAHRRFKNIIVTEVRIELLAGASVQGIHLRLDNFTNLRENNTMKYSQLNPNNYDYYNHINEYDLDLDDMVYERKVIRKTTLVDKRLEANDGL